MIRRGEVAARLELNAPLAVAVLTDFIRDAVAGAGAEGVVVGLSGGVDSSLAAALAVRALGREWVHGFLLPYRTSTASSAEDACLVAKALGVPHQTFDISPMVDAYFAQAGAADRVRMGNKMARERMAILFDQAKALGCLVLGTSNKTEILLGYTTLWGDMAAGVQPLGDLYKCEVRALARHLGVPPAIVEKAPSADLWEGQTDEGELGFTYDDADRVLYQWIDRGRQPEDLVRSGVPEPLFRAIQRRVVGSSFKRRMPIVLKVSSRTVSMEYRLPRDAGT